MSQGLIEIPKLRFYQEELKDKLLSSISHRHKGICAVSPTGSGKSKLMGKMVCDFVANGKQCIIVVHRQELVKQLSVMLGEYQLHHQIIAPKAVVSEAKHDHLMTLGRVFIDPFASGVFVCAVQTLVKNMHKLKINPDVILQDEAHHLTEGSYWGKVRENYSKALLLGFTASPERLDGKGLGVGHGGYFTDLVMGPYVGDLIDNGYLSEYLALIPDEPINISGMRESKTGGMSAKDANEFYETKGKRVCANLVSQYAKHCPNKPMVAYAVSVKASEDMAEQFKAEGFKAVAINGNTNQALRNSALKGLATGEIEIVCNADLISEGFDVPNLFAVGLCRPTQSLALHIQQVGRPLRPHPSKPFAYIFDCVGNLENLDHYPCTRREWSLEGKKGRKKTGDKHVTSVRKCPQCFMDARPRPVCLNCGYVFTAADNEMHRVEMELRAITPEELKQKREQERQEQVQSTRQEQNAAIRQGMTAAEMVAIDIKNGLKPGATAHKQRAIEEKKQARSTLGRALKYWKETCLWGDYQLHDRLFAELFGVTEQEAKQYGTVRLNRLTDKMREYCREMPKRAEGEYSPYEFDFIGLRDELWGGE